jgi:branched-chain amino acid transport system substrate-binding protein
MGAAVTFDGPTVTGKQKAINDEARAAIGESLNAIQIGFYDSVYALKAAIEKGQSIDPKKLAAVMPDTKFTSFYGTETDFYGMDTYGSRQQMRLPVIITQVQDGRLVEKARLTPTAK